MDFRCGDATLTRQCKALRRRLPKPANSESSRWGTGQAGEREPAAVWTIVLAERVPLSRAPSSGPAVSSPGRQVFR